MAIYDQTNDVQGSPRYGQKYYEETATVNGVPGIENIYESGATEFVADSPVVGSSTAQPTTGSPGPSTPTYGATGGTAAPSAPAATAPVSTPAPSDSGGPIMPPPVADPIGRGYYIQTTDDGRQYYTVEETNRGGYWKMYTNGGGGQYVPGSLPASDQSLTLQSEPTPEFKVVMNPTFGASTSSSSASESNGAGGSTYVAPVSTTSGGTGPVDGRPVTLPGGIDPVVGGGTSTSGDTTTTAPVVVGDGGSGGGTVAPGDSSTPTVVASTFQPGSSSGSSSDSSGGTTAAPASVPSGSTYTVVHGDTMWGIAQANGIPLSQLEALNPQISNPRLIFPGQSVNLGSGGSTPVATDSSVPGGGPTYTVVHGDTLSGIAAANGMTTAQIEALNPQINDPNLIFPGQSVNLASSQGSAAQGTTSDSTSGGGVPVSASPSAGGVTSGSGSGAGTSSDSNTDDSAGSGTIGFPSKSSYPSFASAGAEAEKAVEDITSGSGWADSSGSGSTDVAKGVFEADPTHTGTDPLHIDDKK